jgi:phage-related protein
MPSLGRGVEEVRIWDEGGTFRVIYTARFDDAVYVLHVFQKKSQATAKDDVAIARSRYAALVRGRS